MKPVGRCRPAGFAMNGLNRRMLCRNVGAKIAVLLPADVRYDP